MEDPERIIKTKNTIIIVVFMSKESYRKVWEEVKLITEKEMLFIFPEQWKNNRIQILSDEFGKILFTHYTPVIKEYIVSGWHDQKIVERWEKVVKKQNNLRRLTSVAKLKISEKKSTTWPELWGDRETDTTEPPPCSKHREVSA